MGLKSIKYKTIIENIYFAKLDSQTNFNETLLIS